MRTRFCGAISLAGSFIFIVPVAAQTIVYGDPLVAPENFAMQIGAKDLQRYPVFTAREDILRDQAASALLPQSNTQTVNHLRLRGGTATQSVIIEDDLPQLSPIGSDNAPLVLQLPRQDLQEMLLLEGPQSARFAANAASGIVQWTSAENSFTATDEQLTSSPYAWSYTQQVASHGTWREGLNFGKKRAAPNKMWWQVYGQREDSRGISQAAGGQERDGWHATFGKVKFGQNLARWRWSLAAQRWTRKFDLDGGWPLQDTADYGRTTWQTFTGHGWWRPHQAWTHHFAGEFLTDQYNVYGTWGSKMKGNQAQSAWRSTWQEDQWRVEFGHYGRWENYRSLGQKQNEQQIFIWGRYAYHPQGTISYGIRPIWGTGKAGIVQQAAVAREFKTSFALLRPHAAGGTALKRPSLYQKFAPQWGNRQLRPEKSWQSEFGLAWEKEAWQGDLTYFWGRLRHPIIFNWDALGGRYQNGEKYKQKGLSAKVKYTGEANEFQASVTSFLGQRLPYTPTWQSRSIWQHTWNQDWQGQLIHQYQGSRRESDFTKLKPYHYWSVGVIYTYQSWQITGRIENLLRHKYVQMHGYNTDPQTFILTATYQN